MERHLTLFRDVCQSTSLARHPHFKEVSKAVRAVLTPSKRVHAQYLIPPTPGLWEEELLVSSQFDFDGPAINLDPVASHISCSPELDRVAITLASKDDLGTIATGWYATGAFSALLGPHWECGGKREARVMRIVAEPVVDPVTMQILLTTKPAPDAIQDFFIAVESAPPQTLQRRSVEGPREYAAVWPFNFNYNLTTAGATDTLSFANSSFVSVSCTTCYAHGSLALRATLKGNRKLLKSYRFELAGDLAARAELNMSMAIASRLSPTKLNLPMFPLAAIRVPGILTIGAEVGLQLGAMAEMTGAMSFTGGAKLSGGFLWVLESTPSDLWVPKLNNIPKPLDMEPIRPQLSFAASASLNVSVAPQVVLAVNVLKVIKLDLHVRVKNILEANRPVTSFFL
ncbi:hypothetical protein RI367_006674 [Sorochytrium milnesiophthora]